MKKKYFALTKALEPGATLRDIWQKAQAEGYTGLSLDATAVMTKADGDEDGTIHAIFSSTREDRHWDVVKQEFDLSHFKKNPVFLDSHNYDSITAIIGRVSRIKVEDGKLQGDIEFAMFTPLGRHAYELAKEGYLNATSIGFIPKEFSEKGEILKSELLEISAVSVPANPEALIENAADDIEQKKRGKNSTDEVTPPAPKIDPEPALAPAPTAPATDHMGNVLEKMNQEQKRTLGQVAAAVEKMCAENRFESKRVVLKAIRSLM